MTTKGMTYEVDGRNVEAGVGANEYADSVEARATFPMTKNLLWIAVWQAYCQGRADEQATRKAAEAIPASK